MKFSGGVSIDVCVSCLSGKKYFFVSLMLPVGFVLIVRNKYLEKMKDVQGTFLCGSHMRN